jgi:hypothetical protein
MRGKIVVLIFGVGLAACSSAPGERMNHSAGGTGGGKRSGRRGPVPGEGERDGAVLGPGASDCTTGLGRILAPADARRGAARRRGSVVG